MILAIFRLIPNHIELNTMYVSFTADMTHIFKKDTWQTQTRELPSNLSYIFSLQNCWAYHPQQDHPTPDAHNQLTESHWIHKEAIIRLATLVNSWWPGQRFGQRLYIHVINCCTPLKFLQGLGATWTSASEAPSLLSQKSTSLLDLGFSIRTQPRKSYWKEKKAALQESHQGTQRHCIQGIGGLLLFLVYINDLSKFKKFQWLLPRCKDLGLQLLCRVTLKFKLSQV